MTQLEIPLELVHLIMENLAVDNGNAGSMTDIKTCCLVTKSWVPICRSFIFKRVALGPRSKNAQDDKRRFLALVIKDRPHIADFIHEINFALLSGVNDQMEGTEIDGPLAVLLQLHKVHTLSIHVKNSRDRLHYHPGTLYFGWRSLLDRYLYSGQLTTISLIGAHDVPIMSILSSAHLASLSVIDCHLGDILPALPSLFRQAPRFHLKRLKAIFVTNLWLPLLGFCPHLESLQLEGLSCARLDCRLDSRFVVFPSLIFLSVVSVHDWNYPSTVNCGNSERPSFPTVTTAHLNCPSNVFPQFNTLENLHLDFDESNVTFNWSELSKLINDSLKHLTCLSLEILAEADAEPILENIKQVLLSTKGRNSFKSFSLALCECLADIDDWWETSADAWKQFGDVLSNIEDFPCLESASFSLSISRADGSSEGMSTILEGKGFPDIKSILSGPLQGLMERTGIQVHCEVDIEI